MGFSSKRVESKLPSQEMAHLAQLNPVTASSASGCEASSSPGLENVIVLKIILRGYVGVAGKQGFAVSCSNGRLGSGVAPPRDRRECPVFPGADIRARSGKCLELANSGPSGDALPARIARPQSQTKSSAPIVHAWALLVLMSHGRRMGHLEAHAV